MTSPPAATPTGLTIVVATADGERFRTALMMALAQTALGGTARLFLQEGAVALLLPDEVAEDAARYAAAGLPARAAIFADALDAGVAITACQSGLALIGATADRFDPRIEWGGMIGLLQSLGQDRLVVI
ncbi:hypothetical protein G432_15290 [Sphingomonas sp. MM-1]|uniref:DsrE family protein n=1 Tax=Sphingomonas sp. MM-1 TaxID=745310 RepID=UPI0002C0D962|nr:DsrE family protein [Sphingomonas sp. MM-1]AGH50776.1 hypothetical protein G432_15290 [Sphingomonas sp. MM-1]